MAMAVTHDDLMEWQKMMEVKAADVALKTCLVGSWIEESRHDRVRTTVATAGSPHLSSIRPPSPDLLQDFGSFSALGRPYRTGGQSSKHRAKPDRFASFEISPFPAVDDGRTALNPSYLKADPEVHFIFILGLTSRDDLIAKISDELDFHTLDLDVHCGDPHAMLRQLREVYTRGIKRFILTQHRGDLRTVRMLEIEMVEPRRVLVFDGAIDYVDQDTVSWYARRGVLRRISTRRVEEVVASLT